MTDFTLVDPKGWEYDLHSVYSAYIGYFQIHNIPWYERSWGHLFESFEQFLSFSWPVITVTDACTGRAHIVTRLNSVGAFLKMIKTRFGETLPQAPNILQITPFETSHRHMRHVSDYSTYRKLHSTLPAAVLSALKARVRAGEPKTIKEIWDRRDKTFLALDFKWNERNEKSVLEWGYAAVRCGHLEALGHWPPNPDGNYRKGHYIVAEYVDKVTNKYLLNYPWQYAFGDSQVAPKAKLPQIIQAVISSMASPDSETTPNHLVLVGHNIHGNLARLDDMKFKLPHNMLVIDTMVYERSLYASGHRGTMPDPSPSSKADGGSKIRVSGSQLSFDSLLWSLTIPFGSAPSPLGPGSNSNSTGSNSSASPAPGGKHPISETIHPPQLQHHQHHQHQHPVVLPQCTVHNAGNTAVLCLFALQKLLEPAGTAVPSIKRGRLSSSGFAGQNVNAMAAAARMSGMMGMGMGVPVPMMMNGMPMINTMPVNNSRMSMMIPKANDSATSAATPMINVNGSSAALPLPFPSSSPGMQHPPRPSVRPSSYDLAAEFSAMSLDRRNGNRSGGENAETNRPSSAYLTTAARGDKASKRFHSFSGGLTLGGSTSHPKVEK